MTFQAQRPYVPVPVQALTAIEEQLGSAEAASAKLVLLALYRICNREKSASTRKGLAYLGAVASLHPKTVTRRIHDLERLKLVKVARTALRSENTYTLPQADGTQGNNEETLSPDEGTVKDPNTVLLPKQGTRNNSEDQTKGTSGAPQIGNLRRLVCEKMLPTRS